VPPPGPYTAGDLTESIAAALPPCTVHCSSSSKGSTALNSMDTPITKLCYVATCRTGVSFLFSKVCDVLVCRVHVSSVSAFVPQVIRPRGLPLGFCALHTVAFWLFSSVLCLL